MTGTTDEEAVKIIFQALAAILRSVTSSNGFLVWVGVTLGNCLVAFFFTQDWLQAADRSIFEAIAIGVLLYIQHRYPNSKEKNDR